MKTISLLLILALTRYVFSRAACHRNNLDESLIIAAKDGDSGCVSWLIDYEADVNAADKYGVTALMWAIIRGHEEVTRTLIKEGAGIDRVDMRGWTALMHAVKNDREEQARMLINKQADVNIVDNMGRSALSHAVANARMTDLLIKAGAKSDAYAICRSDISSGDSTIPAVGAGICAVKRSPCTAQQYPAKKQIA